MQSTGLYQHHIENSWRNKRRYCIYAVVVMSCLEKRGTVKKIRHRMIVLLIISKRYQLRLKKGQTDS